MVIRLEDVLKYEQPTKYIVKSENYSDSYSMPVLTAGKSFVLGYTDETDGICRASENPVIIFDDFTADCKYVDFDFKVKSSAMKILHKTNRETNLRYYFYAMQAIDYKPFSHKRVWISEYSKFEIENRTVEEQNRIVRDLEAVVKAIDNANQRLCALDELVKSRFIEMFGDPEINFHNWEKVVLSEIITTINNGMTRRGNDDDGNIVLRLVELQEGRIDYSGVNRIKLKESEKTKFLLKENDFLFARVNGNPDYVGRCAVFTEQDEPIYHNDHIIRVHCKDDIFKGIFGSYLFNSDYGKSQIRQYISTSAGQFTINQTGISSVIVILPPVELQNEFAEFVKLIDKSKFIVQKQIEDLQELLDSKMDEYFG